MTKESTVWEFVEKYYPDYNRCEAIAENSDLQKIVDGECEDGDSADKMLKRLYSELVTDCPEVVYEEAERRLAESNAYIYEKAIEGYLATL